MADVRVVQLSGHLSKQALERALAPLDAVGTPYVLIVDALAMTDYDKEAREHFVAWNSAHRRTVQRLAVVTDKPLWVMVVTAMGLASRQTMRAFSTVDGAQLWANRMLEAGRDAA